MQEYVRGWVLWLLRDAALLPSSSSSRVKLMFLLLLEDLDFAHRLGWDSTVLVNLYRATCHSSYYQSEINGYLVLLQVCDIEFLIFYIFL